ncbi:hypothetical protein ES703_31886 [subsurface metagenome]
MVEVFSFLKFFIEIIIQFFSLLLLYFGCRVVDARRSYRFRSFGWGGLALYSFLDAVISISILNLENLFSRAIIFFIALFMLQYEVRGKDCLEGRSHLYVGRVVAAGCILNFIFSYVTFLNGALTLFVALQSIILPFIMGMGISWPFIDTMGNSIWFKTQFAPDLVSGFFPQVRVPVYPTDVAIVYGCTGLREILFLLFAVAFTKASGEKKKKAFFIAAPLIYAANILRNNLVVGLYGGGLISYEIAHSLLGNILVFLAITVAAVATFLIIPEIPAHLSSILSQFKSFSKSDRPG